MILELLVLLVAARLAAEVAERLALPAVATEIAVGILLGPSVLGVVGHDEPLVFLGELGVIVLLLQVGLELDLGELTAVGRPAIKVALIGVALPFAGGAVVGGLSGLELTVAVFVGAALTATSVGITARVFGDLRRLGTVEARTVLGAAVADDVLGLLILTVVAKTATSGTISVLSLLGIAAAAIGFVVVAALVGVRFLPPVLRWADRRSRAGGLAVAVALIVCLAFAQVADVAGLAPIVGAFLAGIGLNRSAAAERIRRELTPIGQFLVPLFFVQVGVAVDVGAVARGGVIGIAAGLLAVAVRGQAHRRLRRRAGHRRPCHHRSRDAASRRGGVDLRRPRPGERRARQPVVRRAAPRHPGHHADRTAAAAVAGEERVGQTAGASVRRPLSHRRVRRHRTATGSR